MVSFAPPVAPLRKKRAQAEFHMLGKPDDFCALVTFFDGTDGGRQVFKIMLHFKAHGHFALLTLWGHFDENTHFVGLSEGYNAMEKISTVLGRSQVSQATKTYIFSDDKL